MRLNALIVIKIKKNDCKSFVVSKYKTLFFQQITQLKFLSIQILTLCYELKLIQFYRSTEMLKNTNYRSKFFLKRNHKLVRRFCVKM